MSQNQEPPFGSPNGNPNNGRVLPIPAFGGASSSSRNPLGSMLMAQAQAMISRTDYFRSLPFRESAAPRRQTGPSASSSPNDVAFGGGASSGDHSMAMIGRAQANDNASRTQDCKSLADFAKPALRPPPNGSTSHDGFALPAPRHFGANALNPSPGGRSRYSQTQQYQRQPPSQSTPTANPFPKKELSQQSATPKIGKMYASESPVGKLYASESPYHKHAQKNPNRDHNNSPKLSHRQIHQKLGKWGRQRAAKSAATTSMATEIAQWNREDLSKKSKSSSSGKRPRKEDTSLMDKIGKWGAGDRPSKQIKRVTANDGKNPRLKGCLKRSVVGTQQSARAERFGPATSSSRTDYRQGNLKMEHKSSTSHALDTKNNQTNHIMQTKRPVQWGNTDGNIEAGTANHSSKLAKPDKQDEIVDLTSDPDKTHVIFAIDFSGSMKQQDVKSSNGRISRWEAVFECIDTLLTQQVQQQGQSNTVSTCLISVLIFNDESQVIMNRMPLVGKGDKIRNLLTKAKKKYTPRGGTGFAAGFRCAEELARPHIDDKVMVVFLSDGRPGDLQSSCPKGNAAMQKTFKRSGVTYPAAGTYIETMQKRHVNFNLQLICLYNEGVHWLKYLAHRYKSDFHHPDLRLDDAAVAPQTRPPKQTQNNDSDSDEEVVEMKVKSAETVIRERCERAKAAGNVVSLTSASTNASSIRSTFSSISATVTAMRSSNKPLQERKVTIKSESVMISYDATRMVLTTDINGVDKFTVAPGESANARKVSVSMHPFGQGGLRNVYRMKQQSEQRQVAKESRHDIKYNERLKFHLETVKCQEKALLFANFFNKKIKNELKKKGQQCSLAGVPRIDVLRAEVYRLKAPSCPGGYRYLAVEKELPGIYTKWNNNDGFVQKSDSIECQVAQAFSHFSYESSNQQKMVVDIQGSCNSKTCMYTDPQLHSIGKEFGRADRGASGFDKFFKTHKCNNICKELGLPERSSS